ncbi:unnamed protein product [Rhizophagus irregularis]|uniref:Uncharacterized protein n=1 Tax=Rhizophagus irregularis TaxID=588596 RepID=A0A916EHF0_9GLOM|nr:unnamed protein product [Rhizophagus irregularis]
MCHLSLSEVIYSVKENYGITQNPNTKDYIQSNTKVALKCLNNSQNFLDEFVNEVKAYTNQKIDNILKIYGISQNPNTKEYQINKEIEKQFNETQEYRKENFLSIKNNQLTTHTQAIYTSRLLNPFTKNLSKYEDNFNSNTVEITDFTNL